VFYHNGTLDWWDGYHGQEAVLLNEYRKSKTDSFCQLLSIMEGFPADQQVKGGYTPVRIKRLIITCPNPPRRIRVNGTEYRGEYETQDRYDQAHELKEWENIDQVIERIKESGGNIVCFTKRDNDVGTIYDKVDVTSVYGRRGGNVYDDEEADLNRMIDQDMGLDNEQ